MVVAEVALHVGELRKALGTDGTLVGCLAGVQHLVVSRGLGVGEALVAIAAGVRPLTRVRPQVVLQAQLEGELLVAERAHIVFLTRVRLHVILEQKVLFILGIYGVHLNLLVHYLA